MKQFIKIKNKYGIAELVFNRPDKRNAFHAEMIAEIKSAIKELSQHNDLRALLIRSEGAHFSAGADLNYMRSMAQFSKEKNMEDATSLFDLFQTVYNCPVPVISAICGASFGGANGIIAASDFAIATSDAKFSFSEVRLGILPATIAPFVIQKIGLQNAMHLFTSGRRFSAQEAKQYGLVQEVVFEENFEESIMQYLEELLKSAPNAVRNAKALVRSFVSIKPSEYREKTAELIATARISDEGQEGMNAFFEKRNPSWIMNK